MDCLIAQREEMISLRRAGLTYQEIADKYRLSKQRVYNIINNQSRIRKAFNVDDILQNGNKYLDVIWLYAKLGMNVGKVAESLGVHRNTVEYRIKKIYSITGYDIRHLNELNTLLDLIRAGKIDLCKQKGDQMIMTKVIIRVEGGLVQAVYSDGDVDVEVVDLDVSDFPEDGEQEAADKRREEMEVTIAQPGWRCIW